MRQGYKIKTVKKLINEGFKVIELYGITLEGHCSCSQGAACSSAGKHPINKDWQNCWIKSEQEFDKIFLQRPWANFGVITGSGLVVIDVDPRHGGLESLEELKPLLNPTFVVQTGGGGFHYYYHTEDKVGNRTNVLPGIDVRGDGGFVVAPGSKHKSGRYYEIIEEIENECITH